MIKRSGYDVTGEHLVLLQREHRERDRLQLRFTMDKIVLKSRGLSAFQKTAHIRLRWHKAPFGSAYPSSSHFQLKCRISMWLDSCSSGPTRLLQQLRASFNDG